ncbi:MAG: His/Gly/Thr/Pro-type tRNA ligase C-terminal domain-containing protein, partial [Candidatus Jorgensenbacteria bacterium]
IGDEAKKASLKFISRLRRAGIKTLESLGKKTLKAQLKCADKQKAELSVIVGQKEIFEGSAIVRDMKTGAQETVTIDKLLENIKKNLH